MSDPNNYIWIKGVHLKQGQWVYTKIPNHPRYIPVGKVVTTMPNKLKLATSLGIVEYQPFEDYLVQDERPQAVRAALRKDLLDD